MDYDQLCKSLLQTLFGYFMRLFFPQIAERLVLDAPEWLPTEMFVAPPEGERRYPDLVAKVPLKGGGAAVIVIHLEIQERRDPQLGRRMHHYYTLLRTQTDCEVFSVALQFHRERGAKAAVERATYTEFCLGEERLRFHYYRILVPLLSAEDYLSVDNPVGWALTTRMKKQRRLRGKEIVQHVLDSLLGGQFTSDEILAVWNFVFYSARLKPQEVREVRQVIERKKKEISDEYMEQGREILRMALDTKKDNMRRALMTVLAAKFGEVPDVVQAKINEMDFDEIDQALQAAATARSLKATGLLPEESNRPSRSKKNGKKQ